MLYPAVKCVGQEDMQDVFATNSETHSSFHLCICTIFLQQLTCLYVSYCIKIHSFANKLSQ